LWRAERRVNVALGGTKPIEGSDGIERVVDDSDGAVVVC
jgi:hypothetical protein